MVKATEYHGHPDFRKLTREEEGFHDMKNKDYAQGGNPLGNFYRRAGVLANYPGLDLSNPGVVAVVDSMKQLDAALWMLSQGYEGEVEDVDTRLRDVHIYAKLARILLKEVKKNAP